jgi:hypothetical protein
MPIKKTAIVIVVITLGLATLAQQEFCTPTAPTTDERILRE